MQPTLQCQKPFKTPLKVLLYVGLLVGGLIFSLETILEYLKGSTSHYSTTEPITLNDIPTLSICWKWKYERDIYGKDFYLDLKLQNNTKSVILIENDSVNVLSGLKLHLSELHHRCSMRQKCEWMLGSRSRSNELYQCFKITPKWDGRNAMDMQQFEMQLAVRHVMPYKSPLSLNLYVTSEKNSFGLTVYQWFDGFVGNVELDKVGLGVSTGSLVEIEEVIESRSIDPKCSDDSIFDCLAKEFEGYDTSNISISINGTMCQLDKKCSPYSFPERGTKKLPVCQSAITQECFDSLLMKIESNHAKYCPKLCIVKEFKANLAGIITTPKQFGPGTHVIRYRFKEILSTKDLNSNKLHKIVYIEYKIIDLISLIGTLGGTLSMFVGFSFLDAYEFILKMTPRGVSLIEFWLPNVKDSTTAKISKYLKMVITLGLLSTSVIFCWQTVQQFALGRTKLSPRTEPVSLIDIPALTICLELKKMI